MIDSAKKEVLLAGFAITEASGIFDLLAEAASRGVKIRILCSDWVDTNKRSGATLAKDLWPANIPRPVVHEYRGDGMGAGMHIKCLLIDGEEILLGSANFTHSGMSKNFEMGVRIHGPLAITARRVFDEFLSYGRFSDVAWV